MTDETPACDFVQHPHPEYPCGVRVATVTADSLRSFLRGTGAYLTPDQIDEVVADFRRNGIDE